MSQSPPNGLGAPDWPWGTTGLQEGDRLAVAALVLHPPRPLATITPGGKPAVPRDEWAQTDVHKASTYSCAHCGLQYEHPQDVYGCIDRHAAEVAPRALAA